jgi:hypothetical protein
MSQIIVGGSALGSAAHRGCSGTAEGTKAIDRAALEETIAFYRELEAGGEFSGHTRTLLAAAEAHLATLPKTKMVEVWRVEWAILAIDRWVAHHRGEPSREEAEHLAALIQEADTYGNTIRCVRITGPHQQEIPA